MEEEMDLQYPYYEMAYLDDDNTEHLAKVKDKTIVDYYADRFTVLRANLINKI